MTKRLLITALLLGAAPVAMPHDAQAQVSVNNSALEALGKPAEPAKSKTPARSHHRPAHARPSSSAKPAAPATAAKPAPRAPQASAEPPLPTIPPAPPPPPGVIPPPSAFVPTRPAPPLPTIPVVKDAPGTATKFDGGLRVTFGPDRADLNPASVNALRGLAQDAKANPATTVNVAAYAAGTPEDPSTPRRLALSRALAARAVLVDEGIPSTRVYVRALGSNDTVGGPPDRVDVTLDTPPPPKPDPSSTPPPAAGNNP